MPKYNQLKIDTEKHIYELNGADVSKSLLSYSIAQNSIDLPTVILNMDAQVQIEGVLMTRKVKELRCEKCGRFLGEFIGTCEVCCPKCGELNIGNYTLK